MNAATARSSSTIANTRWRLADGSEKPATSAGATVAPRPMPVSPEADQRERFARWHLVCRKTADPRLQGNTIPASGR